MSAPTLPKPPKTMTGSVVRVLCLGRERRVFVQHPPTAKGWRWVFEVEKRAETYKAFGGAIIYRGQAARAGRLSIAEDFIHNPA